MLSKFKRVVDRLMNGKFGEHGFVQPVCSSAPQMEEIGLGDLEELKNELGKWVLEDDPHNELKEYLKSDFLRFVYTVFLVDDQKGRLLELGANPYFTTRILKWKKNKELFLANYFSDTFPAEGEQVASYSERNEKEVFEFKHFNSEEDSWPYEDAFFNTVLYCEIIEHLLMDPVKVISEIHRVLLDNGTFVLTTPNVNRTHNAVRMLSGENIYDPYSGYGPYGRHNREYTPGELCHILTINGFVIIKCFTADVTLNIEQYPDQDYLAEVKHIQRIHPYDSGEYIFIAAKKAASCKQLRTSTFYRSRSDISEE